MSYDSQNISRVEHHRRNPHSLSIEEGPGAAAGLRPESFVATANQSKISHLSSLEAESIHIFSEVVAEFERPVMLYSIGKDSSVMVRLAQKAFYPGPNPVSPTAY